MKKLSFFSIFTFLSISIALVSCGEKELTVPNTNSGIFFFNEKGTEILQTIVHLKNGDLLYIGESDNDGFAMRVSLEGKKKWYKSFGGNESDVFYWGAEKSDGNIVLVGSTASIPSTEKELAAWVIEVDANGEKVWEKSVFDGYESRFNSVAVTSENNIITTGYDAPSAARVLICKYKPDGSLIWKRSHDIGPWHDIGRSVQINNDGNYLITGNTSPNNLATQNGKYNTFQMVVRATQGAINWVNLYPQFTVPIWLSRNLPSRSVVTNDGLVWASGKFDSDTVEYIHVTKTDFAGNVIDFTKVYGSYHANFMGMEVTKDGNILISGYTRDIDQSQFVTKYFITKLDGNLNEIWSSVVGSNAYGQASFLSVEHNNSIYVGGNARDEIGVSNLALYRLSGEGKFNN